MSVSGPGFETSRSLDGSGQGCRGWCLSSSASISGMGILASCFASQRSGHTEHQTHISGNRFDHSPDHIHGVSHHSATQMEVAGTQASNSRGSRPAAETTISHARTLTGRLQQDNRLPGLMQAGGPQWSRGLTEPA
jgi:hypothetical protein